MWISELACKLSCAWLASGLVCLFLFLPSSHTIRSSTTCLLPDPQSLPPPRLLRRYTLRLCINYYAITPALCNHNVDGGSQLCLEHPPTIESTSGTPLVREVVSRLPSLRSRARFEIGSQTLCLGLMSIGKIHRERACIVAAECTVSKSVGGSDVPDSEHRVLKSRRKHMSVIDMFTHPFSHTWP